VYRGAWQREDALALLRDGVGTLYDERCVAELEALTAGDAPRPGDTPLRLPAVAPATRTA
jgi:hypothetical protein